MTDEEEIRQRIDAMFGKVAPTGEDDDTLTEDEIIEFEEYMKENFATQDYGNRWQRWMARSLTKRLAKNLRRGHGFMSAAAITVMTFGFNAGLIAGVLVTVISLVSVRMMT